MKLFSMFLSGKNSLFILSIYENYEKKVNFLPLSCISGSYSSIKSSYEKTPILTGFYPFLFFFLFNHFYFYIIIVVAKINFFLIFLLFKIQFC